jgi:hypothetical protein
MTVSTQKQAQRRRCAEAHRHANRRADLEQDPLDDQAEAADEDHVGRVHRACPVEDGE